MEFAELREYIFPYLDPLAAVATQYLVLVVHIGFVSFILGSYSPRAVWFGFFLGVICIMGHALFVRVGATPNEMPHLLLVSIVIPVIAGLLLRETCNIIFSG